MTKTTAQTNKWSSEFGKDYTDRNPHTPEGMDELYMTNFGLTRSSLNEEFLGKLDRSIKILEVGANVGAQLLGLQKMGFTNLYGVELQGYAVEQAKARTKNINLIQGTGFDIPFKDGFFDLVYTSGVLIHISPADIGKVMDEMYRCSNRYIWGCEYFADKMTEVPYRGQSNLLWKANYAGMFQEKFKNLKMVKEKFFKYINDGSNNVDTMYLLEK